MHILLPEDAAHNQPIQNYIMQLVEQNNELKNMFIRQNAELTQQNTELHEKIDILSQQPAQVAGWRQLRRDRS